MSAPPILPQIGFRQTPVAQFKLAGFSSRKLRAIQEGTAWLRMLFLGKSAILSE
jgi:hypothetical protein